MPRLPCRAQPFVVQLTLPLRGYRHDSHGTSCWGGYTCRTTRTRSNYHSERTTTHFRSPCLAGTVYSCCCYPHLLISAVHTTPLRRTPPRGAATRTTNRLDTRGMCSAWYTEVCASGLLNYEEGANSKEWLHRPSSLQRPQHLPGPFFITLLQLFLKFSACQN